MPRRQPSLEKQMIALIAEALTCSAFCKNNPGWVLEARNILGLAEAKKERQTSIEINQQQQTLRNRIAQLETLKEYFEIEFDYKGFKVELWKNHQKGFTYRRRREGEQDWRQCADYFASDRDAVRAVKAQIDFGEA